MNFLGFQTILAQLAADRGLANYDPNNSVETMVKDTANMAKSVMEYTADLVDEIPVLGPMLAPSESALMLSFDDDFDRNSLAVYQIKCITDAIIDAIENLTDAIINSLMPLLQSLGIQATQVACDAGVEIAGFCVL